MARKSRMALADLRALETQADRNEIVPLTKFSEDTRALNANGVPSVPHCGRGRKRAPKATKAAKSESDAWQQGMHLSKHLHELHGAGFWDDFKNGFNSVFSPVASIVRHVAPLAAPGAGSAVSGVLGALGYGSEDACRGSGKRKEKAAEAPAPAVKQDKRKERGAKISKLMSDAKAKGKPITLAQASAMLKRSQS